MKTFQWMMMAALLTANLAFAQGSLTPPGAPAETMKTLAQIEPRTPISSVPFVITNSGSYYLTGTLVCNLPASNGITIYADNVTIDLAGQALIGPGADSGNGICLGGPGYKNLTVMNGKVQGWAGANKCGINAATSGSRIEGVQAISNYVGLSGFAGSLISQCSATYNTDGGIGVNRGTIRDCSAEYNGDIGIFGNASVLTGCAAAYNASNGIEVGYGSVIRDCTATFNTNHGFSANSENTFDNCTARQNGGHGFYANSGNVLWNCVAGFNILDGFRIETKCRVENCSADSNGYNDGIGAGIYVCMFNNRLDGNHVANNGRGIEVVGTDNLIVRNSAVQNTTNYVIAAGNNYGPISDLTLTTPPAVSGNLAPDHVYTSNPWANFAR